ncbi:dynein axonemal assembly factor 6 [Panulirus ornatus]|uniref:dynein axonemal assembly factor 6 n=1 Tax=Panulirus ornatus TaxID=150431 RepID=UPI003A845C78
MSDFTGVDVRALADLLHHSTEDDDPSEETSHRSSSGMTPGDLAGSSSTISRRDQTQLTRPTASKVASAQTDLLGDIWKVEEVMVGHLEETCDPRPQPKYEVNYRQRVSASHVYLPMSSLGMSGEEDLIVRVELPGDLLTDVNLEVTCNTLRLDSPGHYLHFHFPQPVDQHKGVATWDPTTHTLVVTLPTIHHPLLTPTISH